MLCVYSTPSVVMRIDPRVEDDDHGTSDIWVVNHNMNDLVVFAGHDFFRREVLYVRRRANSIELYLVFPMVIDGKVVKSIERRHDQLEISAFLKYATKRNVPIVMDVDFAPHLEQMRRRGADMTKAAQIMATHAFKCMTVYDQVDALAACEIGFQ